jgi:hypothetical protein
LQFSGGRFQVVAAVLVVALLAGTYLYFTDVASAPGGTTTRSSTQSTEITLPGSGGTTTRSSTQSTSSTSSAITIVSSTTLQCTSSPGSPGGPASLPDYVPLFTSISQMTMVVQQVSWDQYGRNTTSSATVGFKVLGQVVINATKLYQVNLQVTVAGANGTSNTTQALAYFDQAGDLALVSQPNLNESGSAAVSLVAPYLDPFNYELTSNQQLATYSNPNSEKTINQTTVTLGSTVMNVTYAEPTAIPYSVTVCGQTTVVENVLFAYGLIPGSSTPIITYYYSIGTDGVNQVAFAYKVLTVTRA